MPERSNTTPPSGQLPGAELAAFRQRLDAARSLTDRARILHELSERLAKLEASNAPRSQA